MILRIESISYYAAQGIPRNTLYFSVCLYSSNVSNGYSNLISPPVSALFIIHTQNNINLKQGIIILRIKHIKRPKPPLTCKMLCCILIYSLCHDKHSMQIYYFIAD